MKVADLPTLVIEELCQSEYWRIDIDPGLDAKHEFFLRWEYLLLFDTYHSSWFTTMRDARYGFLAIAERYTKTTVATFAVYWCFSQ